MAVVETRTEPVHVGDPSGEPPSTGPDPARLRRRRRWMAPPALVIVVAICLAAVPVAGGLASGLLAWAGDRRPFSSPHAFDEAGGFSIGFPTGVAPGTEVHVGVVTDLPDVHVVRALARLRRGSGPAAVTVNICRARPAPVEDLGDGGAVVGDELQDLCAEVLPADGRELGPLRRRDSLVLTIVPLTRKGVRVDGVDLTYEQGGDRTTQHIGADVDLGTCADPDGGLPGPVC